MKRRLSAFLLVAVLLSLAACVPPAAARLTVYTPSAADPAAARLEPGANAGLTAFGVELLRLTRQEEGENTLLSPLSAALALSMTANGAAGETLTAFEDVLGAELDALNANAARLTADYAALGGSAKAALANSLWADSAMELRQPFVDTCAGYDPGLFTLDLDTEGARGEINRWIETRTGGMIRDMLRETLSENTALLLVNTLYLENAFSIPFNPHGIKAGDFTTAGGETVRADFMEQTARFPYFRGGDAQGALLPYDDGRLAFGVILPDGDQDDYLEGLDGAALAGLIASAEEGRLTVSLPKFEARWSGELRRPLSDMGLETAFDPGSADFSPMGSVEGAGLYLENVLQNTCLEVNEAGTRAAAATAVQAVPSSAPDPVEEPPRLVLDRPFLYAVWDTLAGLPLFLGVLERV